MNYFINVLQQLQAMLWSILGALIVILLRKYFDSRN